MDAKTTPFLPRPFENSSKRQVFFAKLGLAFALSLGLFSPPRTHAQPASLPFSAPSPTSSKPSGKAAFPPTSFPSKPSGKAAFPPTSFPSKPSGKAAFPPTSLPFKPLPPLPPSKAAASSPKESEEPPTFEGVTRGRRDRAAGSTDVKKQRLEEIAKAQTSDLLVTIPNLQVAQHAGRGKAPQYFLRGFDAVHGSELEVRVQGIPINEVSNIHGQGYADIQFLLPDAILRIGSRKGPFYGDQGDFAIGGSLEIDLGLERRGVGVQTSLGTAWDRRITAFWGPQGMGEETFVGFQIAESEGIGQQRSWAEGMGIAQGMWRIGRLKIRAMFLGYYGRFETPGVLPESDVALGKIGFYETKVEGLGGSSSRVLGQIEIASETKNERWSLMLYAGGRDLRLVENYTGALLDPRGDTSEQLHRFFQTGGVARWQRRFRWFGWTQTVEMGLELRADAIEQAQYRLASDGKRHTTEIQADIWTIQGAAWGSVGFRPLRWLRMDLALRALALGMRVEETILDPTRQPSRSAFGLLLAPRTVLTFSLRDGLDLTASYGLGYRSPQARSLRDGERTPFQEAHHTEVGLRYRLQDTLEASLAGFLIYLAEELVFDHASARNLYAGQSLRGGFEASLGWQAIEDLLRVDASVSYSEGTLLRTQEPVPYAPRLLARLGVSSRWQSSDGFWGLLAALRGNLIGPKPLPFGFWSETIFLLSAVLRVDIGPVFLRADLRNLLNSPWKDGQFVYPSRFESDASKLARLHFTAGEPFTFLISLGFTAF